MNKAPFRHASGFTLVEIMVGLTVGLVTVLVVMQVMQVAETRRRSSTSGADAVVNAALGLYTIERDGKNAGYGMTTVQSSLGCPVKARYGSDLKNFNLVPVTIVDDANGAPDTIQFLASNKNGVTLPTRIAVEHSVQSATFFVESDLGITEGDMMIAVPAVLSTATPPTTWCSVFQATKDGVVAANNSTGGGQGRNQVLHNSGRSDWNQPGGQTIFPTTPYGPGDHLINLGSLVDHTYKIANNHLVLTDYKMATNDSEDMDLYPNVVQLQAVYGKDTSTPRDNQVDAWNATAPTTPAEWQQVIAMRVALVARGQSPEPEIVTLDGANAASTCNSATPHPAAVCWKPDPNGNGVKINVATGNPSWQRYRYRVVETTIPLRNAIWRQ